MLCIDFGSDNCFVGIFKNDKVEVIPTEDGIRNFACDVSFTEDDVLIGNPSKIESFRNFNNRVTNFLKYIHQGKTEQELNEIVFSLKMKQVSLKEVLKIFISKIKKQSEFYTGKDEIKECVLSIPDDFQEYQLNFLKSCFQEADLTIVSTLNYSTCIALSYGLDKYHKTTIEKKKTAFLIDNGSDSLNLSLVQVSHGGLFKILSSKSYKTSHVSGNDFDEIIFNFCLKEFSKKNKVNEEDFKMNKKSVEKLKLECEKAKITLSNSQKFNFDIDSLFDGYDYHSTISRSRFEMISTHLLKNLMEMLDQFLGEVSVDEILLSGGTSSIPKLQSELLEHFEGKDVKQLHAYNESVIIGLCLESSFQEKRSELVFNPSDILVKNQEGNHVLLFPKDTLLPSSTSMECLTSGDLKIYQQEDLLASIFVSKEHSKVSFHLSKEGTMKIQVNQEEEINL